MINHKGCYATLSHLPIPKDGSTRASCSEYRLRLNCGKRQSPKRPDGVAVLGLMESDIVSQFTPHRGEGFVKRAGGFLRYVPVERSKLPAIRNASGSDAKEVRRDP